MPVQHTINEQDQTNKEMLLARLVEEWLTPHDEPGEPMIIEESPSRGARTNHIYVVWNEWENLTPFERSKIILQAYEKYRGHELALDVTLAMGLTPTEADKLHLNYGTV